jgi:hypothetical protein
MWFSIVFAAAIEIVAGLGFAFVQMTNRAQWLMRQRELVECLTDAQLGLPSSASSVLQANSNSVAPRHQPSLQPKRNPTSAKFGSGQGLMQLSVQPGLQPKAKTSSTSSNPVKAGVQLSLQPTQPSSSVQPSLPPTQPSSPSTLVGVLPNPVHPDRPPSAEHDATEIPENSVRPKLGITKPGKRCARRDSVTRAGEEAAVRAFLAQLSIGPGRTTQATELHREYLQRARVQGWPMLNKTAFGLIMTKLVKELGFEKRKEGTVTIYYRVGIATEPKFEPVDVDDLSAAASLLNARAPLVLATETAMKKSLPRELVSPHLRSDT